MRINDLRKSFISYFEKSGHKHVHSSPLVPQNDPTLMFANSGMVQFKNVFTGLENRDYNRAVTAQKCIRAGGKHNDLENVGYTLRHHTFFEMLGNFSFGDYFKDEAIEFAWKFITNELGINRDKLCVTIYHNDEQAYEAWKKITGFHDDKIIRISTKDNFWSMGDTGPCGPCSEIFYDHGEDFIGKPPSEADETGDRFVEIWNLVFMQYEQINKKDRVDLPSPSIDTGMGIERIAAVMQGTNDNYKVDSILEIINNSKDITKNNDVNLISSHRVIADHLRSSCFLIADGVLPSNEGRGYVLRRIMRRAMRHVQLLNYQGSLMYQLAPILISNMKDAYPELSRAELLIHETLKYEESKFSALLENGMKQLNSMTSKLNNNTLNGELAFKLYDTYGFPIDLTQDILKNKNIDVDIEAFNEKLDQQREQARKNWSGTGSSLTDKIWFDLNNTLPVSEFLGYSSEVTEGTLQCIIKNDISGESIKAGEKAALVFNQTVFYAESGGQVGDTGLIKNDHFEFTVTDTQKRGNLIVHFGIAVRGKCELNENLILTIDKNRRHSCRTYHSATHILHQALRDVLGDHVTQKGSLVSYDKLRFDFSHHKALSDVELEKVENKANLVINNNSKVETKIMSHEDAIKAGALALFGEKYSDEVRVLSIGEHDNKVYSIELCGGTHVNNTNEIGRLEIVSESSVASGVRRIEALRGNDLDKHRKNVEKEKLIDDEKKLHALKMNEQMKKNISQLRKNIKKDIEQLNKHKVLVTACENIKTNELRQLIDETKIQMDNNGVIVICSINEKKISFLVGVTDNLCSVIGADEIAKYASSISGGKGGGGRKEFAQSGGELKNENEQKAMILQYIIDKLD